MPKWRHIIQIKEHFSEEESDEVVLFLCKNLVLQLKKIFNEEKERAELNEDLLYDLDSIISAFQEIGQNIQQEKLEPSYVDEGNWVEEFNEELDSLYDLGDEITEQNSKWFERERFIFVA